MLGGKILVSVIAWNFLPWSCWSIHSLLAAFSVMLLSFRMLFLMFFSSVYSAYYIYIVCTCYWYPHQFDVFSWYSCKFTIFSCYNFQLVISKVCYFQLTFQVWHFQLYFYLAFFFLQNNGSSHENMRWVVCVVMRDWFLTGVKGQPHMTPMDMVLKHIVGILTHLP